MSICNWNTGRMNVENSIYNWSARAIWRKSNINNPLDLLPNRQNCIPDNDLQASTMFVNLLNYKQVVDKLQKLASDCTQYPRNDSFRHIIELDDKESETIRNYLKIDGQLVLVLYGECFELGDYFYVGCSLCHKHLAPKELISKSAIFIQDVERRNIENAEQARITELRRKQAKIEQKIETKKRNADIAKVLQNTTFKKQGETLSVGDSLKINANQAMRDAIVVSVHGNEALIRYYMPNGREFLRRVYADSHYTIVSVSPNNIPKKFNL